MSAPAAWAKIGGESPTGPKSAAPTFSDSKSCGPAGNSAQVTDQPSGFSRSSMVPRCLRKTRLTAPFWKAMRNTLSAARAPPPVVLHPAARANPVTTVRRVGPGMAELLLRRCGRSKSWAMRQEHGWHGAGPSYRQDRYEGLKWGNERTRSGGRGARRRLCAIGEAVSGDDRGIGSRALKVQQPSARERNP